jgi:hypothetical protein
MCAATQATGFVLALLIECWSNTANALSWHRRSPGLTTQQAFGEQTDLRQNPEKLQARWSQTYSAQTPLSENVPQPVEHRWPV